MTAEKEELKIFLPGVRAWGLPRVYSLIFTNRRMVIIHTGWIFYQKAINSRSSAIIGPKEMWITGEAKKNENDQIIQMRKEFHHVNWDDIVKNQGHNHIVPLDNIIQIKGSKRIMENLYNFKVKFKNTKGNKQGYTFIIPMKAYRQAQSYFLDYLPQVFEKG